MWPASHCNSSGSESPKFANYSTWLKHVEAVSTAFPSNVLIALVSFPAVSGIREHASR